MQHPIADLGITKKNKKKKNWHQLILEHVEKISESDKAQLPQLTHGPTKELIHYIQRKPDQLTVLHAFKIEEWYNESAEDKEGQDEECFFFP